LHAPSVKIWTFFKAVIPFQFPRRDKRCETRQHDPNFASRRRYPPARQRNFFS
jgi:hypothetical protein